MLFVGNLSRVVLDCKCAGSVGKKLHSEADMHRLACSRVATHLGHVPGNDNRLYVALAQPHFELRAGKTAGQRRARGIHLFRGEYIFDVERAVVVETPQPGHATYVFAKPRSKRVRCYDQSKCDR